MPPTTQKQPPLAADAETRGGGIGPVGNFKGRQEIYQIVNGDIASDKSATRCFRPWWSTEFTCYAVPGWLVSCGQAAVATVLTNYKSVTDARIGGIVAPTAGAVTDRNADNNINLVWDRYPPDAAGGWMGTMPQRMVDALAGFGVNTYWT